MVDLTRLLLIETAAKYNLLYLLMKMLNQYSFKNSFNITKKLVLKLQHKNFFSGLSTSNLNLEKINQRVFCLTLCRHDGKNSFSKEMVSDFNSAINALRELNRDEAAVTVLILKSSVDRVFCAGADLKERLSMPEDQIAPFVTSLRVSIIYCILIYILTFILIVI